MKALKLCGIALSSGLLVGVVAGSYMGRTWTGGLLIWREMSAGTGYAELSNLQYAQADTEHGRQALLGFTKFLKVDEQTAQRPRRQGAAGRYRTSLDSATRSVYE